ncbi:MAG: hypothetical protein LBB45_06300 [Methanobrevibacter sp.]|jgi:transposase|nr:hypothetical protein [Candidatus Methanovirga basalitermitum]
MKNNRYYASIIFLKIIVLRKNSTGRGLGLDWSEREIFLGDFNHAVHPTIDLGLEATINELNTKLSKKKSHSKNWYKLKNKIDRLKEYKSDFINDWEHGKSLKLVNYADFIGIEDINFKSFHNNG